MVEVAVGILLNAQNEALIDRRPEGKIYAGYWEFPGGKIEAGETPVEALVREFKEELGIDTSAEQWTFFYDGERQGEVAVHFYLARTAIAYQPQSLEQQTFCWQHVSQLDASVFPEPNTPVIAALKQSFA